MKRRNFLASIAALPFAGCAIFKPFVKHTFPPSDKIPVDGRAVLKPDEVPYEEVKKTFPRKVIDYANINEDEFGKVYRRTVEHSGIKTEFVKEAMIVNGGDLLVASYCIEETDGSIMRVSRYPNGEEIIGYTYLPRDEWVVKQYDGCGKVLREITAQDYLA